MVSLPTTSLIVLLTIVSSVALASPLMHETTSCLTGDFKSFEAFYDSVKISAKREVSEAQKQKTRANYARWKRIDQEEIDCRLFTYTVDNIPVTGFLLKPKNVKESDLLPLSSIGEGTQMVPSDSLSLRQVSSLRGKGIFRHRKLLSWSENQWSSKFSPFD